MRSKTSYKFMRLIVESVISQESMIIPFRILYTQVCKNCARYNILESLAIAQLDRVVYEGTLSVY